MKIRIEITELSFKVFLFAAGNTDVERSISGFGDGKVDRYTITTSHDDEMVKLGASLVGNSEFNICTGG